MTASNKVMIAMLLGLMVAGCSGDGKTGYTLANQYRGGIRTVAVPIWGRGKDVYRRENEFRITEAVIKRIEMDTPYKVVDRSRADTELTGSLTNIEQRVLSRDSRTGNPRELEITFIVSFTWKDLRSGQILVQKENFRVAGTYIPAEPLAQDFFWGAEDVINKLARRVVEQMEADW